MKAFFFFVFLFIGFFGWSDVVAAVAFMSSLVCMYVCVRVCVACMCARASMCVCVCVRARACIRCECVRACVCVRVYTLCACVWSMISMAYMLHFLTAIFYVFLPESPKPIDVHVFLFDDLLLITKIKKTPRKVRFLFFLLFVFVLFCFELYMAFHKNVDVNWDAAKRAFVLVSLSASSRVGHWNSCKCFLCAVSMAPFV